jgi:hypothetical protein
MYCKLDYHPPAYPDPIQLEAILKKGSNHEEC